MTWLQGQGSRARSSTWHSIPCWISRRDFIQYVPWPIMLQTVERRNEKTSHLLCQVTGWTPRGGVFVKCMQRSQPPGPPVETLHVAEVDLTVPLVMRLISNGNARPDKLEMGWLPALCGVAFVERWRLSRRCDGRGIPLRKMGSWLMETR